MEKNSKSELYIVGIVAIIAVVGLVVLVLNTGSKQIINPTQTSQSEDSTGQAYANGCTLKQVCTPTSKIIGWNGDATLLSNETNIMSSCTRITGSDSPFVTGRVYLIAQSTSFGDNCNSPYFDKMKCSNISGVFETSLTKYTCANGCTNAGCNNGAVSVFGGPTYNSDTINCTRISGTDSPYVYGKISYNYAWQSEDYCKGPLGDSNPPLNKMICSGSNTRENRMYNCSLGCKDGACVRTPIYQQTCSNVVVCPSTATS